ncbi:hypothetical protein M3Y99_00943300 [Aphelenchoides fujianensis]|nr:hypothetical protein M3Y99_00943300 [Aphelenchoides fujianensis]
MSLCCCCCKIPTEEEEERRQRELKEVRSRNLTTNAELLKATLGEFNRTRLALWITYLFFLFSFAATLLLLEDSRTHVLAKQQWHARYKAAMERRRFVNDQLMPRLFNNSRLFLFVHEHKSRYLRQLLLDQLTIYERRFGACPADANGVMNPWVLERRPFGIADAPTRSERMKRAWAYAFTTATTIGSCDLTVRTPSAQLATALFGLLGIPFTILIVRDLSSLLLRVMLLPSSLLDHFCWHPAEHNRVSAFKKRQRFPAVTMLVVSLLFVAVGCAGVRRFNRQPPSTNSTSFYAFRPHTIGSTDPRFVAALAADVAAVLRLLTTTAAERMQIHDSWPASFAFAVYSLLGFSLVSLAWNSVFARARLPRTSTSRIHSVDSRRKKRRSSSRRDSDDFAWVSVGATGGTADHSDRSALLTNAADGESVGSEERGGSQFDDNPLSCSYHTVGIFRAEEPLHRWIHSELRDVGTQTDLPTFGGFSNPRSPLFSPQRRRYRDGGRSLLPRPSFLSHDDVASLLVETYRPAGPSTSWSSADSPPREFV